MTRIKIGRRTIGDGWPTFFIADISANHDGDLGRARALIHLAAEAGADAAKFQNFRADHIVSDRGFRNLGGQRSHQGAWKQSVYEVYKRASIPWEWTESLREECDRAGIDYFSAPYDLPAVDMLDPYVSMFKIGSGDITWPEILRQIASKGKPVFLAAGASDIGDVQRAVNVIRSVNPDLILMQCNTNYTGSTDNFRHIHLNVLHTFAAMFPDVLLGLSDHTPGHATALGAVALGACAVEKHFTDDNTREGPDHSFSLTPPSWREMVDRTRELEAALGSPDKRVADNELDTVVIQRRCLRAGRALPAGAVISRADVDVLRPAPQGTIPPYDIDRIIGMRLREDVEAGAALQWFMVQPSA